MLYKLRIISINFTLIIILIKSKHVLIMINVFYHNEFYNKITIKQVILIIKIFETHEKKFKQR